jgi:hypothetical protein
MANKGATRAVIRNLDMDFWPDGGADRSSRYGRAFEHMGTERAAFEINAKQYLRDKSNLRTSTLELADWDQVFNCFYPQEVPDGQVTEALEAIAEHQPSALKAAAMEKLDQMFLALMDGSKRARTYEAESQLASAAHEVRLARGFLLRGVNGDANVRLHVAHKILSPLRTRVSTKAIKDIKTLGLL